MRLEVKRRLFAVGALLVAGGVFAALFTADLGDDLVYYWSPTELIERGDAARGTTVRIMGLVEAGTVDWRPDDQLLAFSVTDGSKSVRIEGKGAPPQMFREGIGVVVEGELSADGVFRSHEVLVKHNNEYKPPEDGTHPGDMSGTLTPGGT